ncbi:transcriptional regulator, LacI family [Lachnospiraceae bacterium NK3A20]|nr:transcriptional regulator, LacI family [Lachnospiraceae bacterium NK3A20]
MATTIKDIAGRVGVSPSTVSRVINGSAPISEEVKLRIRDAMKEMDYHPNARARSFATGVTNTVGLVINASNEGIFSNSFFNRSVYAIEKTLQDHSYNLLIANDNGRKDSQILELVLESKVDGLIIPSSSLNQHLLNALQRKDFPLVVMGQPEQEDEQLSWTDIDNYQGAIDGTKELLEHGYQEIVLIIDDGSTLFARNRMEGYRQAVQGKFPEQIITVEGHYHDFGKQLTDRIRDLSGRGYLCSSNELAFHLLKTLKGEGVRIPEDAGIVTFDNYPLAEYMEPQLTAIDVDTYQLGRKAAELLIEQIHGHREVKHELIMTSMIRRRSSEGSD